MKKNNMESGRSMVEMLAVLAIMAVLSVIALYGYRIVMCKMRANELIYGANKRAISAATQFQTGAITASLNEFVDNDLGYATFSTDPVNTENGQFKIGINGVAQDICGQMKGTVGMMIRAFDPDTCTETNTVYLTYNNDLSMEDTQIDLDNGPSCAAGEYVTDENGEEKCCRGYRDNGDDWEGYSGRACCSKNQSVNRYGECVDCGEGNYYNMLYADLQGKSDGTDACGKRCKRNENCAANEFCWMDAFATDGDSAVDPIVGSCVTAEDVGGIVEVDLVVNGASAGRWMGPRNNSFDWWSARNFCLRYGHVDLPTRSQICGSNVSEWEVCDTPLRRAIEEQLSPMQEQSHFWLEATGTGKAYYADPSWEGYVIKIPPERTARARPAGVVCGPVSSGANSGVDSGTNAPEEEEQPACDEGQENWNGRCVAVCPAGILRSSRDGTCSVCANGNVYLSYNSNPCSRSISGCRSNDDCESGEFCNLNGSSSRSYPDSGTCESIGTGSTYTYNSTVYTKSPRYIQWWGAVNWCRAQGLEMISFDEMNPQSSWSSLRSVFGTSAYFFTTTSVDSGNVKGIRLNTSSYGRDDAGRWNSDYYALCR